MSCRHRDSWLIAGGSHEWCYRCGALRQMRERGIGEVVPISPWVRPVGPTGTNPFTAWRLRFPAYVRRLAGVNWVRGAQEANR
jgi:hypothetical protein